MIKKEKSSPWDLSDKGVFKDRLLSQLKSTQKSELSDMEMESIIGGFSDFDPQNQSRCAYWVDDGTGIYVGCSNCQNKTCKDIDY